MRTELSQKFIELDSTLKKISGDLKDDISNILAEQIGFLGLVDKKGAEFLKEFMELIPHYAKNLRFGVQTLSDFNITYSNVLQAQIRECFARFYPDKSSDKIDVHPIDAQVVRNALATLHDEVINNCEQTLINSLSELNRLFYAAIEEFIDRVIRAEGTTNEWMIFFAENCDADFHEAVQNWQQLIAEIEVVNNDIVQFL